LQAPGSRLQGSGDVALESKPTPPEARNLEPMAYLLFLKWSPSVAVPSPADSW
jgi:hypothetical protein